MNKASLCSIFFLAVLVAPVLSQDELPSPEAFATECKADIVHLLQQMDVFIQKIEAGPESGSRLKNEFEITSDRIETKLKFCEMTSGLLGPAYKSRMGEILDDPELKLVMYKLAKTMERISIQSPPQGERSPDEIEHVFQTNEGSIFNLYNRALRKDPSLAGRIIIELTISPEGQVTAAKVLSSDLENEALERKLLLTIKRFKFRRANVREITVTYPIDFLPS